MTNPAIAELANQVRAGLAADEQAARACVGVNALAGLKRGKPVPRWVAGPDARIEDTEGIVRVKFVWARERDHILRHDPARVLADVAAKQALLDEVLGWMHDDLPMRCPALRGNPGPCDCGRDERVCTVLQYLAQPYQARQ